MDQSKKHLERLDHDQPDPKILPPSDDQLYEIKHSSEKDADATPDARKWQVPDDAREESGTGEIYSCQENSGQETSPVENSHPEQINGKEVVSPPHEDELYSLKEGETPISDQPAPDMQVLFKDSEFQSEDLYEIGPGPHPTEADAQQFEGIRPKSFEFQEEISLSESSDNPSPTNEEEPELYGVSEPEKPFYASDVLNPNRLYDDPDEKDGFGPLLEGVSVDEIYSRRMMQNRTALLQSMEKPVSSGKSPEENAENDDESDEEDLARPKIPRYPFRNGIFLPFKSPGFILRLILLSVAGLVPFYLGIWFFSRHNDDMRAVYQNLSISVSEKDQETDSQNAQEKIQHFLNRPMVNEFLGMLYKDRLVLFFICFIWGIFSTPYFLQVFTATASGDDKIAEWPEGGFFAGILQFLWLMTLVLGAGIPGWLLMKHFGYAEAGFIVGTIFLVPIFFLSCMATDSYARILSTAILKSFKPLIRFWRWFYLISILLILIGSFLFCCFLWMVVTEFDNPHGKVILASLLSTVVFSILPVVYLRYLGRLGWLIQDYTEKKQKEREEKENEDEPLILTEEK